MPSTPQLIQHDFTAGIRRSRARDDLGSSQGANVLWNAKDWIIGRLGVPLGKRGGWGVQGSAMTDGGDTANYIRAITNDPFNGGNFMRAVDEQGFVWRSVGPAFGSWTRDTRDDTSPFTIGGRLKQNGVFIADGLFYPSPDGSVQPFSFNETYGYPWPMAGGGAGFYIVYLAIWLNRLVGLDAHENLWFGAPDINLTAWDEDAKYLLGQPGRGLAGVGKELLVFFDGHTKKVRGTIPAGYGITQDDIIIEDFSGDIGCIDAFSICKWNTQVIWVDHNGVWTTDGATYPLDLTWAGGAKDLFLEFMRGYSATDAMRVAAGIYSNLLVISMTNLTTNEFVDCIVCDLGKRTWSRWTNAAFTCFTIGALGQAETWAGVSVDPGLVATLSGVLDPTETNVEDGNDVVVEPSLETAYYRFGAQDSRIHRLFCGYEIETVPQAEQFAEYTVFNMTFTWANPGEEGNGKTVVLWLEDITYPVLVLTEDIDGIVIHGPETGTTTQDIVDLVNGGVYMTATTSSPGDTFASNPTGPFTFFLAGGSSAGGQPVVLKVDWALDPSASPDFFNSYTGPAVELDASDIHGDLDNGYHWKPVPVRDQSPGIAVRIAQSGPSIRTAIHGIGSENQPHPTYSQR